MAPTGFSSSMRDQMMRDLQHYERKGRSSDMSPLRTVIAILLFLVCAGISVQFGRYAWSNAQICRMTSAAAAGNLGGVKARVAGDAHFINALGYMGRTPMWWAAAHGRTDVMAFLREKKADVNLRDANGWSPLHAAAAHDQTAAAQLLVKWKADLAAVDGQGRTPLHAAATGPNTAVAAFLLEARLRPDAADTEGWTPLHVAVSLRQVDMVNFLLANRANINAKTNDGRTPLRLANQIKRNDTIIDTLMEQNGEM
ncbi:MAG: ankyrin repeat domain-containing protein [Armatimonadota bacterium]